MTVFGGTADALVTPARLHGWRRQTSGGSRLRLLPGGPFFLHTEARTIMEEISRTLPGTLGRRATVEPGTAAS